MTSANLLVRGLYSLQFIQEDMMYAITFDLDMSSLRETYQNDSYTNACMDIRKVLVEEYGFDWQQGSVYFGGSTVDAVTCVLAVQDLASRYGWFASSVRDIRMLRIEENNDLMPAVKRGGVDQSSKKKRSRHI
jgi:virulence-associated protein VapD